MDQRFESEKILAGGSHREAGSRTSGERFLLHYEWQFEILHWIPILEMK
jgi:hypothetical protein